MPGMEDWSFGEYEGTLDDLGKKIRKAYDKATGRRKDKKRRSDDRARQAAIQLQQQRQQAEQRSAERQKRAIFIGIGSFAAVAIGGFLILRALR